MKLKVSALNQWTSMDRCPRFLNGLELEAPLAFGNGQVKWKSGTSTEGGMPYHSACEM